MSGEDTAGGTSRAAPPADERDGPSEVAGTAADPPPGPAAGATRRRRPQEERRRRPVRTAIVVLLGMLLVVVVAVAGFAVYLDRVVGGNVQRKDLLPPDASRAAPAANSSMNILLLGSDSLTADIRDASRSDVIQLVHLSGDRRSVQVVHFPRDLYVDIPTKGRGKINAAYAYGGAPLLVQTLERLLAVRIDHVAQIGFEGFRELTDTVGGVDVDVRQPTSSGGYTFTAGINHLDGDRALAFVRERKQLAEGDIDRGRRQQAWMRALLDKTLRRGTLSNPVRVARMVDDTTRHLVVDRGLDNGALRSLAFSLRGVRGGAVTFLTAPFSGFRTVPGVGSVDVVDQPAMRRLGVALREDSVRSLPGGTTSPG